MIEVLTDKSRLGSYLVALAREKGRGSVVPPRWANQILDGPGFKNSLAGFISNSVKKGKFCFGRGAKPMTRRKGWEAGSPEYLTVEQYQVVSDEGGESNFRQVFRLALPDALLQGLVGKFVTRKLELILSDNCHAYRRRLGQPTAVQAVRTLQANQDKWVVEFDVASFNATIDHAVLMKRLTQRMQPQLTNDELRIVVGTIEAYCQLSEEVGEQPGKGLLMGSGLLPPLTNLYLTPLDQHIEQRGLPFVRYGDDLVVFCQTEKEAREVLSDLGGILHESKQEPSDKCALGANLWLRGLELRYPGENGPGEAVEQRRQKKKTDWYAPGEPFDFIGFDFDGPRVHIRQETLAKVKSRLEQYTQLSKSFIQHKLDEDDHSWGEIFAGEDEEFATPSVRYIQCAINRINSLLGFKRGAQGRPPEFWPGRGFAWNILRCLKYEDVKEQFRILDAYAFRRLNHLKNPFVCMDDLRSKLDKLSFRENGLRTFKDVANRFPKRAV